MFSPLVTFCVLIDYLGNVDFPQIGATTFYFASFFLSLDDSESLGASTSSLTMFFSLFLTESLLIKRFNLVESNGTKTFYMVPYLELQYTFH